MRNYSSRYHSTFFAFNFLPNEYKFRFNAELSSYSRKAVSVSFKWRLNNNCTRCYSFLILILNAESLSYSLFFFFLR